MGTKCTFLGISNPLRPPARETASKSLITAFIRSGELQRSSNDVSGSVQLSWHHVVLIYCGAGTITATK